MSMRLPPKTEGKPWNPSPTKISSLLNLSKELLRSTSIFCVCYSCCAVFQNDTIMSGVMCPNCPSSRPMMNFPNFEQATQESYRAAEILKRRADGQSIGGA